MPKHNSQPQKQMNPPGNPFSVQWRMLSEIASRTDRAKGLFGIDWLFRLFICASLMLMPAMFIRGISGKFGYLSRKISIELYALGKPALLSWILLSDKSHSTIWFSISVWMFCDLYLYLFGLIFLSRFYTKPASFARSVLLLGVNFIEAGIAFAIFYSHFYAAQANTAIVSDPFTLLYFSFVTSATIGYGDISPANFAGKLIAIIQILSSLGFISLFVASFVSNLIETERA